jgi:hypothetical protein
MKNAHRIFVDNSEGKGLFGKPVVCVLFSQNIWDNFWGEGILDTESLRGEVVCCKRKVKKRCCTVLYDSMKHGNLLINLQKRPSTVHLIT